MTFDPEEIIEDIEQVDEGWWIGTVRGARGLFPVRVPPGHTIPWVCYRRRNQWLRLAPYHTMAMCMHVCTLACATVCLLCIFEQIGGLRSGGKGILIDRVRTCTVYLLAHSAWVIFNTAYCFA